MPMTSTERANRFRAMMRESGAARFEVTLSAETLATIKVIAKRRGLLPWQVIEEAIRLLAAGDDAGIEKPAG